MRIGFIKTSFNDRFLFKRFNFVRVTLLYFFVHFFLHKIVFLTNKGNIIFNNYFNNTSLGSNICYFSLRKKGSYYCFKASRFMLRPFILNNFGIKKAIW